MRDYGKVYTAFWISEDIRGMSEDGRMLALYLMTCQHGNMLGCFRLTNAYAADDLQWEIERVAKGFDELLEKRFAYRCGRTFWVFIRQFLKWNRFENPNVGVAAGKMFDTLSCPSEMKSLLAVALREFAPYFPSAKLDEFQANAEPFDNPFELSPKTVAVSVAVSLTPALTPAEAATGSDAASAPVQVERRKEPRAKNETPTAETWELYTRAYRDRYKIDPVRNATTNAQMANFVRRIGAEEAPSVAAFYVRHNDAYYVREMHGTGPLLAKAEALRTQWATGNGQPKNKQEQLEAGNRARAAQLAQELIDEQE
jgi:hypothetical protein